MAIDPRRRPGFSLMEMLVVLAIIGLSTAIVAPRGSVMLDRITLHAVFFDFQRQMSDLRREAYRRERPILVVAPRSAETEIVMAVHDPQAENDDVIRAPLDLKEGFSVVFDRPPMISAAGQCSLADVEIMRGDRRVMRLEAVDDACGYRRLD